VTGLTGARDPRWLLCGRARSVGLVGLGFGLQVMADAAPAQQADGERPTRGKRRRADRHWGRLRCDAGHVGRHGHAGEGDAASESPIAFPFPVVEIARPVYPALDGQAVRERTDCCARERYSAVFLSPYRPCSGLFCPSPFQVVAGCSQERMGGWQK